MTYKRNCSNDDMFESMIFICCYVVIRILVCVVSCVCVCVVLLRVTKMMNGLSRTIFYSNFFTRVANKKIDSFYSLSEEKSRRPPQNKTKQEDEEEGILPHHIPIIITIIIIIITKMTT